MKQVLILLITVFSATIFASDVTTEPVEINGLNLFNLVDDGVYQDGQISEREEFEQPDLNRFCRILHPGQSDWSNRRCVNPSYYAVTYEGLILDGRCYSTYEQAIDKTYSTRVCQYRPPARLGSCEIYGPGRVDRSNRRCTNMNYYSVSHGGYIMDGRCYQNIDQALSNMEYSRICDYYPPVRVGRCQILYPSEIDASGRRCTNGNYYSVTRDGYILNNSCYATMDQALQVMRRSQACFRRRF